MGWIELHVLPHRFPCYRQVHSEVQLECLSETVSRDIDIDVLKQGRETKDV